MHELNMIEASASEYYLASIVLFSVSRFIFTWLMKYISPVKLLIFSASMAILSIMFALAGHGLFTVIALISISGFMSLMFPTIFGIAVEGLGKDIKIGGSGLIIAILGGALITLVQGKVSDISRSIQLSYIVPLICFGIIPYYGIRSVSAQKVIASS